MYPQELYGFRKLTKLVTYKIYSTKLLVYLQAHLINKIQLDRNLVVCTLLLRTELYHSR